MNTQKTVKRQGLCVLFTPIVTLFENISTIGSREFHHQSRDILLVWNESKVFKAKMLLQTLLYFITYFVVIIFNYFLITISQCIGQNVFRIFLLLWALINWQKMDSLHYQFVLAVALLVSLCLTLRSSVLWCLINWLSLWTITKSNCYTSQRTHLISLSDLIDVTI